MKGRKFYCGGALLLPLLLPALASAAPIRVAVLPVVVQTAGDDSSYLSKGLVQMLSARLEQAGGIEVEVLGDDAPATTNAAKAIGAASSAGADFAIFGSFTQFGDGASLDLHCARVAGFDAEAAPDARQVFIQSGRIGDIIPRLDDVSSRIALYMKGDGPAVGTSVAASDASSEAGDLERRIEALERAVFPAEPAPPAPEAVEAAEEGE